MKDAKRFLSVLLVCCMIATLTACGGGLEKKILGSWAPAGDDEYMTFYSSGTVTVSPSNEDIQEGTWVITGENNLEITLDGDTFTVEITAISSDSMTWENNGKSIELLKRGN